MFQSVRIVHESSSPASPANDEGSDAVIPSVHHIFLCGECGIILARGQSPDVVMGQSVRCPNCGAVNAMGGQGDTAS